MENKPIIFGVEDISGDEVLLGGGCISSGSYYDPPEYAEVSKTAADAFNSDFVYLVGCGDKWTYLTDEGQGDAEMDVYSIAKRLAVGAHVTEAEMASMHEWLTEEVGTPADKVWDELTEKAQERFDSSDHGYEPEPDDYM